MHVSKVKCMYLFITDVCFRSIDKIQSSLEGFIIFIIINPCQGISDEQNIFYCKIMKCINFLYFTFQIYKTGICL